VRNEQSLRWLGPALIYSFEDLGISQAHEHDSFGILTARGRAKRSYLALKRAIASGGPPGLGGS
jgi:hypothetical protein